MTASADRPAPAPHVAADMQARRNRTVLLACSALVLTMVGAAFAAVPFYEWFCKTTGYAGTTQVASVAPAKVLDREFEIRFDANVRGVPWRFEPVHPTLRVKAGEVATAEYTIENLTNEPVSASAVYNVAPDLAGAYFTKIVCFCFTEQKLGPKEKITVPVTFFVDPEIDQDKDLKQLGSITLSYSFFPAVNAAKPVAVAPGDGRPAKL